MFNFLERRRGEREACSRIGVELHRQIKESFDKDESRTSLRLQTTFTAGYVFYFVRSSFFAILSDSDRAAKCTDKYLKSICDGVLPKRLNEIIKRMLDLLDVAEDFEDKDRIISGTEASPAQVKKAFELGCEAGYSDGGYFSSLSLQKPQNLKKHLLGEALDYKPLPRP